MFSKMVVDILPEKITMASRHSIGTSLANVSIVQKQQPNVVITRTFLLQDNAAPHKNLKQQWLLAF